MNQNEPAIEEVRIVEMIRVDCHVDRLERCQPGPSTSLSWGRCENEATFENPAFYEAPFENCIVGRTKKTKSIPRLRQFQ
ncbi:hypothetical protein Y032_0083g1683 [Ancylostoma ceylanicum]|uniref:Uncharacterized protein n=1 Tax=Ancylostoma ceylanicum TaxID=53326 RepID=A0A016TRL5_9BILA|nr:hypothetical protein Y032_0083g1683 [Ancylostoma ceylanicum]